MIGTIDFSVFADTTNRLYLHNNDFYGNVTDFGQMTAVDLFYIHGNRLDGTVDWSQFELLDSMTRFYFYDNFLTGDVDLSYIDNDAALVYFYGYDNEFDGTINLGAIEETLQFVYLYDNPGFIGGVDFSTIASTSTEYPRIWFDEPIYCDPSRYCNVSSDSCTVQQDRNNPSTGYCSGKIACEATCVDCLVVGCPTTYPTNSPTDDPSPNPTDAPSRSPTGSPTRSPTPYPTDAPTRSPTRSPSRSPTMTPTKSPTGVDEAGQSDTSASSKGLSDRYDS